MIKTFPLKGLRIQSNRFGAVEPRNSGHGLGVRVVSAEVLAQTRVDTCRCEDPRHMASLGLSTLHAGTLLKGPGGLQGISPEYNFTTEQWEPVPEGKGLESGCMTGKHICPRLDKVRRIYGL